MKSLVELKSMVTSIDYFTIKTTHESGEMSEETFKRNGKDYWKKTSVNNVTNGPKSINLSTNAVLNLIQKRIDMPVGEVEVEVGDNTEAAIDEFQKRMGIFSDRMQDLLYAWKSDGCPKSSVHDIINQAKDMLDLIDYAVTAMSEQTYAAMVFEMFKSFEGETVAEEEEHVDKAEEVTVCLS